MSDAGKQSWTSIAPMSTARNSCAAAAVGDTVYVFGGQDGRKALSSAEAYDVETRSWSPIASMSTKRYGCAAAAVGDSIYVFGGYDGGKRLSSAEAYDVRTRRWSSVAPMSTARNMCAAAAVGDTIFVFGGFDSSGKNLSSAEAYNVRTQTWSSVAPMSTARCFCAAAAVGDTIFVFGGNDCNNTLSSAEAYNVRTRTWSSVASMSTARFGCAAAAVGDTIFVFGGWDGNKRLSSVEAYDTRTRSWSPIAPMSTARYGCVATAVGDSIFVFGGHDGGKRLSSAEVYDVRTRSWSSVAPMSTERYACAAAVAKDGIYVVGGEDGNNNKLSSAEALSLPPSGMSPFYTALIAEDDRNINLKITELIPLLEDVHQIKFFYTLVNASYRMGYLDGDDRNRYAKAALEKAAQTTTCTDSVTLFKLVLKKAHEDGAIDEYTMIYLDRKAEVKHTSSAPFVADIWKHMEGLDLRTTRLETRVDGLESRTARLETRVGGLESCTARLETHAEALHTCLVKLQKGIRRQKKIEAAVGVMGAVLNAVSFGIAGSAVAGVVSMAIGNIVDFGDLAHIQAVAEAIGDVTVSDALHEGLKVIEGMSSEKLYAAAKEGQSILRDTYVRAQLTAAAQDGNPLAAIAVTAHVISVNYGEIGQTSAGIGSAEVKSDLCTPPSEKKLNPVDRVKRIESVLYLTSVPPTILKRVNNLEEQILGESQEGTGCLIDRISYLEKELGLD